MIQIEKNPPDFGFSGNPMIFKVISDNEYTTQGSKADLVLAAYSKDESENHGFTIEFDDKSLVFVSKATPDESGLQYPSATPSDTLATWVEKVVEALRSNYYLSVNFDISADTSDPSVAYIGIVAKVAGDRYSITYTNNSSPFVMDDLSSGEDPVTRENFAIVASIWDKYYQKIAEDIKPVDSNGNATFDFSEYLSAFLDQVQAPRFTFPEIADVFLKSFDTFIMQYYSTFAEKYSGAIRKMVYDDARFAIPGGLSRESLVYYNSLSTDFFAIASNFQRFLTWAPLSKLTNFHVPEKLYFLIPDKPAYAQLRLIVHITYTDGTTETHLATSLIDATPLSVFECMVGHDHLKLADIHPAKTVSNYKVYLGDENDNRISEVRTFEIDSIFYEHERVFIFENSFGRAYDVVRFTGQCDFTLEMEHSTGILDDGQDFTFFNPTNRKFSAKEAQKMKTSSGWVSREMKEYLRELLLSRKVYEIKDGLLYPVIITNQKISSFLKDGEYLYSLELEYDRAYSDFFFQN